MTVAVIILGLIAAGAFAFTYVRERAHDLERARLLDRIQAPAAAAVAAVSRAIDGPAPASTDKEDDDEFGLDLPPSDDLIFTLNMNGER